MEFQVNTRNDINSIPNNTFCLRWNIDYISVGDIPDSVKYLGFGGSFNQSLAIGHIPESITYLDFGYQFNRPLDKGHIPDSVTHLIFSKRFNQQLKQGYIPNGVTYLEFSDAFNQELHKGDIPDSVVTLCFGRQFDKKLSFELLPLNLEAIACIGRDTPIDLSDIPLYIKIYIVPCDYNIDLSNVKHQILIPSSICDHMIITDGIFGVHYIDTIEENNMKYLLVHGDDYVYHKAAKSARK